MNHKYEFDFLRIIQIDGSDIYYHEYKKIPLSIKNEKDEFNDYFCELFAPNLDLLYLDSINKLKVQKLGDEQFSYDFVSVTFKYRMRLDEKGNRIIKDKEQKISKSESPENIREYLYSNGFTLNGVKYVRYKRSSGAARSGTCLFIRKTLFLTMEKWSNTKLNPDNYNNDLVSFEAYKALSLSSLIDTINLKPHNILFVKDFETMLPNKELVARVSIKNDKLKVEEKECEIKNNIWDGEGLLDESVFKVSKYSKKGMMLLRNRFFKSCVFNTKLQKWFKENNIENVDQLNGVTFAKNIEDIKMVITESSLKYLKMLGGYSKENIKKWCDTISNEDGYSLFGIVKTDKPQRFFYGDMVETTYQLLNTLHLPLQKTRALLAQNIDYISKIRDIKNTPEYLRLYLKGEVDPYDEYGDKSEYALDDSEDEIDEIMDENVFTYKKLVCDTLLDINKDVLKTSAFRYFVYEETIGSLAMKLYSGRVLVHGTYATLFGNPYELLLNIIGKFNGKSEFLHKNEVCSKFFDETEIVGSRSPHVTMGNILVAKNVRNEQIEKWFNLSREIVIVDAIENNIQHRLNGADYDSDTMLITDDKIIVGTAKASYKKFVVPYADFGPEKPKDKEKNKLSKVDNKIANNRVGTIINYSQLLNSYYWDCLNQKSKKDKAKLNEIYLNIAKLAVLSGAEIDSAKRSFPFSTKDELTVIQDYLKKENLIASRDNKNPRKPLFFFMLSDREYWGIGEISTYISKNLDNKFKTTMDYIWDCVYSESLIQTRFPEILTFSDLTKGHISKSKRGGKQYKSVDRIITYLSAISSYLWENRLAKKDRKIELEKRNFKKL